MAKPILQRVNALDGNKPYSFAYVWNGVTIVGSVLTIKNETKTETDIIIETSGYLAVAEYIPSETCTLTNGNKYSATLQVKYSLTGSPTNYEISETSDSITFYCFETPKLTIEGFNETARNSISMANLNCKLNYDNKTYSDNILNTYKIEVYQNVNLTVLLKQTEQLYTKGNIDTLNAYVGGLENDKTYYLYCYGVTNYGMEVEGSVYEVIVEYNSSFNSEFQAKVVDGHIELNLHKKVINGRWGNSEYKEYDEENARAIVNDDNQAIYFDNNFDIAENFKTILECRDIILDNSTPFITFYDSTLLNKISLIAILGKNYETSMSSLSNGIGNVKVLCLSKNDNGITSMTYSNALSVSYSRNDNDNLVVSNNLIIKFVSKNGYFDININKEGV